MKFRSIKQNQIKKIGLLLLFLIPLVIMSVKSFLTPLAIEKTIEENIIIQETTFDYEAKVQPSTLYPSGFISPGKEPLFAKITDELHVTIQSGIETVEPVLVKGSSQVNLLIEAEGMWNHVIPLSEFELFETEGTSNRLLDRTYKINLKQIFAIIEKIDEEIGLRANRLNLKIIPEFDGVLSFNDNEYPITLDGELRFESSNLQLSVVGDSEYLTSLPITKTEVIPQSYLLFGAALPLEPVRWTSLLLCLVILVFVLVKVKPILMIKIKTTSEAEKIEKKYNKQLIHVSKNLVLSQKTLLPLKSFESLLQVSEQKEVPILQFNDEANKSSTFFYCIDQDVAYMYEANKKVDDKENELRMTGTN